MNIVCTDCWVSTSRGVVRTYKPRGECLSVTYSSNKEYVTLLIEKSPLKFELEEYHSDSIFFTEEEAEEAYQKEILEEVEREKQRKQGEARERLLAERLLEVVSTEFPEFLAEQDLDYSYVERYLVQQKRTKDDLWPTVVATIELKPEGACEEDE